MAEETVIRVLNQRLQDPIEQSNKKKGRLKFGRTFWVLSWAALVIIIMGSLSTPLFEEFDKQLHFIGYLMLGVLFTSSQKGIFIVVSLCSILGLSVVIEVIQGFMGRSPDWSDLLSNGYGVVAGFLIAMLGKTMFRYFKAEKSNLLSKKRSRRFPKGKKIFSQGEKAKYLYVVLSGEVLLYRKDNGEKKPIDIVYPGEVFGEMGLITDDVRFAAARASEECDVFVMSKEELFYTQNEGSSHPAILVLQTLARRLQQANEREAQLLAGKSKGQNQ